MDGEPSGRVGDLVSNLRADWWKTLFDNTYLLTDADAVEDPDITSREVDDLIRATGIAPGKHVLDLCCGQGRHLLELAQRGFDNVTGVDGSAYLIGVGRERAKAADLHVRLEVGDVRQAASKELGRFDCVTLLGNSFGYLQSEEDDATILVAARKLLRPEGIVYLDVADGEWLAKNYSRASWEWVGQKTLVCRERVLSEGRLVSREIVIETDKGVTEDRTYAERLYPRSRVLELLHEVGFTDVHLAGEPTNGGMDPGMMAHRFTVVGKKVERVTVLLGDPRLPDQVKPSGGFDATDIDTVTRMKSALASLPGYTFQWQDDHHPGAFTAFDKCDLVLNLCDEGYRNDPRGEATVPALLDTLGIPHTGAGPGCLNLCYDKALVRALAVREKIPVPREVVVAPNQPVPQWPGTWPVFVKPALGDSSVGIDASSLTHDQAGLEAAVEARRQHGPILAQEFLRGTEYSVGLLGNPGLDLRAMPVLEVDYTALGDLPQILGYESKWLPDSPWWQRVKYKAAVAPPPELLRWSEVLFRVLGCRDYARFDWRCDSQGTPRLLEVNPNPGWCWDGKMALMAAMGNTTYEGFLATVMESAARRG